MSKKSHLNAHANVSIGAIGLIFSLSPSLLSYFVYMHEEKALAMVSITDGT